MNVCVQACVCTWMCVYRHVCVQACVWTWMCVYIQCGVRSSCHGGTPAFLPALWSVVLGRYRHGAQSPNSASPPDETQAAVCIKCDYDTERRKDGRTVTRHTFILNSSLLYLNRKSDRVRWSKVVGRNTRTKCKFPGNEPWGRRTGGRSLFRNRVCLSFNLRGNRV